MLLKNLMERGFLQRGVDRQKELWIMGFKIKNAELNKVSGPGFPGGIQLGRAASKDNNFAGGFFYLRRL